jgi:predicted MFS family arabinose efflux permease
MLIDQGLTIEDLAHLVGTIGFTFGLLGSLIGGVAMNLLGHRLALRLFLAINVLAILAYARIAAGQITPAYLKLACGFEHFAGGLATVALFTEMMYHCRPQHEATDYTLQACLVVLVGILGSAISGFIAQGYGYSLFFTFCAALTLAALPMVACYQTRGRLIAPLQVK